MEGDKDLPPLLDSSEAANLSSTHPSFYESSTNVSVADSAAATQGSESFRDFSDRGQNSSESSSESGEGDEDSFAESASNTSNNKVDSSEKGGFRESDMSSDEDWVEEQCEDEHLSAIKYRNII